MGRTAIESVFRREHGRVIATLIRQFGDFDLAEDALQDAYAEAIPQWEQGGTPANPAAWILAAARSRAIDRLRRAKVGARKAAELAAEVKPVPVEDDRLRLMFTCCHPALALDAQVALTLHTLGGLTTPEIAAGFLLPEPTLAQRLVRAKTKIRDAKIPYRVPEGEELDERRPGVLSVLYLVFNEGYSASAGDSLVRRDLCAEAIRLARTLVELTPTDGEAVGLLALMLLQDSRREARVGAGSLVLLEDQDRSRWDRAEIAEGRALVRRAFELGPGSYAVQAAIASVHASAATAAETDWRAIVELYDVLLRASSSPVVELNRAVAVAMASGPAAGLEIVDRIGGLDGYLWFHSTRADFLRRLGRKPEAAAAYRRAVELSRNPAERDFLEKRLVEVDR